MSETRKVMVLDDDAESGRYVCDVAEEMGLSCKSTTDPMAFLEGMTEETTLIFLDLVMPEMDGVEMLRMLGQRHCKASIVLMSGADKRIMETVKEMAGPLRLSVVGHIQKPARLKDVEAMLRKHAELHAPAATPERKRLILPDADLRNAVERNEFVLHYQPQIEIATGAVSGVEALVRWRHPGLGLVFPDDFVGAAERLGLIDEVGWMVAERGLTDIAKLEGELGVPLNISINVAPSSLHDLKFPDTFQGLLATHGVPARRLILEITEGGLIQEASAARDVLTRLRMKGVGLSIDDFGTGYSMLGQLRNIPATELKIDKGFVGRMLGMDGDRVMVEKTIEMGRGLGLKVVAEGVETTEQLQLLRSYRCDTAQGYLVSRPLPVNQLEQWLEAYRLRRADQPPPGARAT
jgi:EAL domain-containing protein (putative c-di-GMP-specific phosphodiesterase class I)/FixJ family two-component response regulator